MIEWVRRLPLLNRGIATISVEKVAELGFQTCGDLEENAHHICIHCLTCNRAKDDCRPEGNACSFTSPEDMNADSDRMRRQLADAISLVFPALKTRAELLEIFATDVDGTTAEKNKAYAHRLQTSLNKTSSESAAR